MKEQGNTPYNQSSVVRFLERPSFDIVSAPNRKILEIARKTVGEIKISDTKEEIDREKMNALAGLLSGTDRDNRLFLRDKLLRIKRSLGQGINKTELQLSKRRSIHPGTARWRMNALAALNIKRRQMKETEMLVFLVEESLSKDFVRI